MAVLDPQHTSVLDSTLRHFKPKVVDSPKPKGVKTKRLLAWAGRNSKVLRNGLFATVGFGSPVVAAFEWQSWAGWCALGVAALLWDKAVTDERSR
jgi:hypothetical protein